MVHMLARVCSWHNKDIHTALAHHEPEMVIITRIVHLIVMIITRTNKANIIFIISHLNVIIILTAFNMVLLLTCFTTVIIILSQI